MVSKIIVVIALLIIIGCLGSGMVYLLKDDVNSERLVKALTWRIALSIALFAFLFIAYFLGWIHPHGIT